MILVRGSSGRLYYDLVGPRNKPVVCLLHSIAADSGMWAEQTAALLDRGFRVLRMDFPGHGGSSAPSESLTFERLAADVIAILDANGIDACHVVGLSIGGVVGQALAVHHAGRVLSLVVASAVPKSSPPAAAAWQTRIDAARNAGSLAPFAQGMIERWVSDDLKSAEPSLYQRTMQTIVGTTVDGFCRCAEAMQNFDFVDKLGSVRAPTLVLSGSDDQASPPAMGQLIAQKIPGARYQEIPRGRHIPNLEFPGFFNKALVGWLDQQVEAARV